MSNRDWNIALACALVAVAVIGACERRSYWREQAAKPAKPAVLRPASRVPGQDGKK